ncbi:MAG: EAL domain-containing protein [Prochlorococcaceae cyanobacterium]
MPLCCDDHDRCLAQLKLLLEQNHAASLLSCCFRYYEQVEAVHGGSQAERLLSAGQQQLQALCPADAQLWRLHSNEVVIAIPGERSLAQLEELAHRCVASCGVVQQAGEPPLLLHVAIGAARAQAEAASSNEDLLAAARLARQQAQQRPGSQVSMAAPAIWQLAAQHYQQQNNLAAALEQNGLIAYLQPITNLSDGQVIGFECLARWPQSDGRVLNPQEFLLQAQSAGLTADIDLQVLGYCLKAAGELAAAAGPERRLLLSSNISAPLLENPRKIEALLQLIENHPLPATLHLQLELLEESLNNAACELDNLLEWLSEQHVLIAIDDFGTGYSSLSRLHDLAVNTIKVDRSFVARIDAPSKPSNHLLKTLVAISDDLEISLTAEGIETESQRQWLLDQGVEHGQGFLFSEPLSLTAAIDYLSRANSSVQA